MVISAKLIKLLLKTQQVSSGEHLYRASETNWNIQEQVSGTL